MKSLIKRLDGRLAISVALYAGFASAFLSSPATARALGAADRGLFSYLTGLVTVLPVVVSAGWNTAARILAVEQDAQRLRATTAALSGVTALAVLPIIGAIAYATSAGWLDSRSAIVTIVGVALIPVGILRVGLLGVLVGVGRHNRTAAATVVFPTLGNLVAIGLYVGGALNLATVSVATVAGICSQTLLAWLVVPSSRSDERASRLPWRDVVVACRGTSGVQIAEVALQRADLIFLLPLIGRSELGLYSVATGIAAVAFPAAQALVLSHYRALVTKTADLRRFYGSVVLASAVVCVAVVAVTPKMLPIVFGDAMRGAIVPTCISALAYVPFCVVYAAAHQLTAAGQGPRAARLLALGLSLNVAWAIVLRSFGATGGALASLFAYVILGLVMLVMLVFRDQRSESVEPESDEISTLDAWALEE